MERKSPNTSPKIAILIALLVFALIIFTLHKELPRLQAQFQTPFPQILLQAGMWYDLAEVMFHSASLIMVYGLISLLFPKLRFILQTGAGMANLAAFPYLFSLAMTYRGQQPGIAIQPAIFMFLLCMILPFLVWKFIGAVSKV